MYSLTMPRLLGFTMLWPRPLYNLVGTLSTIGSLLPLLYVVVVTYVQHPRA
jgi:hypothetical protein